MAKPLPQLEPTDTNGNALGPDDPVELLRKAAGEKGPAAVRLLQQAAQGFLTRRDLAQAVHTLEQAIATATEDDGDRRVRAQLENQLGNVLQDELSRLDGALLHYQRAFKLQPEVTEPLHRGRAIYRALGDLTMVSRLFELELASLGESRPLASLYLGLEFAQLKLRQQNDPTGAASALNGVLHFQPNDVELPEAVLETLAEAYVSPDFHEAPEEADAGQALRQAGELYLALGTRLLTQPDAQPQALSYLRRALGADPHSAAAAAALEGLYKELPSPQRETELALLYRTGARVPHRGMKLVAVYEAMGTGLSPAQFKEAIAACRERLEEAETLGEWQEARTALRRLLEQAGDLHGQAALFEEDATEAALPEERADLLFSAADLYRKAGALERYLEALRQALREAPLSQDIFRRLADHYGGRRDFASLAVVHEIRLSALVEAEELDPDAIVRHLEELADLYEKKLQDAAAAADVWRRIDEIQPSQRARGERKRIGQRLSRIQLQIAELQMELDRTSPEAAGKRSDLLRRLGHLHREHHDPQRAAIFYEELLLFTPSDVQALKSLYELRELEGDVPGQIDVLRRQVGFAGDRAERLGLLRRIVALASQAAGQMEATAWACRALLKELPSDRDALRRLAETQELSGDTRGLLDTLESHVKVAPTPREKLPLHQQAARLLVELDDLPRATDHLVRAARLCPPGAEQESVLMELARIYGLQHRLQEQLQTIEVCLRQNARASAEAYRMLGRATLAEPRDHSLEERSLRAWREVQARLPNDLEALSSLAQLHRSRGEWPEVTQVLHRWLEVPDQQPARRLAIGLELAEVLSQRLDDQKEAAAMLSRLHQESPICDRQLHNRLRALHEELGAYEKAIRHAECALLLTEDPLGRMELAMQIAALWRNRVKDHGRALLSYERVLELLPQAPPESVIAREGRRFIAQAMDSMSELYAEAQDWPEVVALGDRRLTLATGEPMRAASIMLELAAVCEEKLHDPRGGFVLRQRAWELTPETVPLSELSELAMASGLYAELCELHLSRIEHYRAEGLPPPLDAVLAASRLYEERLDQPQRAYEVLRRAMPTGPDASIQATTPGKDAEAILAGLARLSIAQSRAPGGESIPGARDLLGLFHSLVDDLCGQRGAAGVDTALRIHALLGAAARLREEAFSDPRGALEERLRAFSLGGDRDHGDTESADAVFADTIAEVRRLALVSGQLKEALLCDSRRLERADSESRRQQVACDAAAWLDDSGVDPPRALRACLKALALCDEGGDAQAEIRGRLFFIGKRLGALAWEDIARTERGAGVPRTSAIPGDPAKGPAASQTSLDAATLRRRLRYIASLWEHGARDITRAIEATGQAYRLTFFAPRSASLRDIERGEGRQRPTSSDSDQHIEDLDAREARPELRAELARLSLLATSDIEGPAKVVSLLDGIAAQLNENDDAPGAADLLLDAAGVDERRGRLPHAERRYQEVLRADPGSEAALTQLLHLYRQQRRAADLAALLERRRNGLLERLQKGPARKAMLVELAEIYQQQGKGFEALDVLGSMAAEDATDPEPHHRIARLHEGQRAFARAADAYLEEAERASHIAPERAIAAFLRTGDLFEQKVNSPERALSAYRSALNVFPLRVSTDPDPPGEALATAPDLTEGHLLALAGIERILDKQQRLGDLDRLLGDLLEGNRPRTRDEQMALLWRRIRLLSDRLRKEPYALSRALSAAEVLAALAPDDDQALAQKEQLQAELLDLSAARDTARQRAEAASHRGADETEQAARWVALAQRELQLDREARSAAVLDSIEGAIAALDRALALRPEDVASLRTLAELRQRTGDLHGEVAALQALAEREDDPARAIAALLQAANVQQERLNDPLAARALLEQILRRSTSDAEGPGRLALSRLSDLTLCAGDLAAASDHARRELLTKPASERAAELHTRLGRISQARGALDHAREHFAAALAASPGLLAPTRELVQLLWPEGDHCRIQGLLRATLVAAAQDPAQPLSPMERAALLRELAEASLKLGEQDAGYRALLEAETLHPGTPDQQLALGELAFDLLAHDVAARYLGGLLSLGPPDKGAEAGRDDALHRGAVASLAIGAHAQARALWEEALRFSPDHAAATDSYVELLLTGSPTPEDFLQAESLLLRRAGQLTAALDLAGAVRRHRDAARTARLRDDGPRARELLKKALDLALTRRDTDLPGPVVLQVLLDEIAVELLEEAQHTGDLAGARGYAERLLQTASSPAEQAGRLRQLARLDLLAGNAVQARAHLQAAIVRDPADLSTYLQLLPLLSDEEAAHILCAALADLPAAPAAAALDLRRALAFAALGAAQARLGEVEAAGQSYDRAVAEAREKDQADGPGAAELQVRREALGHLDGKDDVRVRQHLDVLREQQPLDLDLLSRLHRLEQRTGRLGHAQRLAQVLRVLHPEADSTSTPGAPSPSASALPPVPTGVALEEADHEAWALPEAWRLADIMATLFDGVAGPRALGLEAFGVSSSDRLPPSESSTDEVARLFALCCRVLGNRRANLYRDAKGESRLPLLCAHPPTGLVVTPAFGGRPQREQLFLLGRGVELLRPEYILAEAALVAPVDRPSPEEHARLLDLAVRAFHPRHVRHASEAVTAWRRELPYRAVKRLSDLFREHADTPFSSPTWRRAVRQTANRAGLLLCGDLVAAAAVLGQQDTRQPDTDAADTDLHDLARFWISETAAAIADRLRPRR